MGVLGEQLRLLSGRESTAQHFERLSELRLGERALALHIVVLEEVLNSFAFVLGAVGALADLFKDNILYVSDLTWFVCLVVQVLSVSYGRPHVFETASAKYVSFSLGKVQF